MAICWDEYPVTPTGELDEAQHARDAIASEWQTIQAGTATKTRRSFNNVTAQITQEIQRRSPAEQSYSDHLICDALLRFANLDAMKAPGAEFRDTMSVLVDQLRALVPKRQQGCLPHTPAGYAHAIRRSQIFLIGVLTIKWSRSNGRSLVVIRRVER